MKQIQRAQIKEEGTQKLAIKQLSKYLITQIVIDYEIDEFLEEELTDEQITDEEIEDSVMENIPDIENIFDEEDFIDTDFNEETKEEPEFEPFKRKKRKFIAGIYNESGSIKVNCLEFGFDLNCLNKGPYKELFEISVKLRYEIVKFIANKQRDFFLSGGIKRLTQRDLMNYLNELIKDDKQIFGKIKEIKESYLSRILDTILIKDEKEKIYYPHYFFRGRKSKISDEEFLDHIRIFLKQENCSDINQLLLNRNLIDKFIIFMESKEEDFIKSFKNNQSMKKAIIIRIEKIIKKYGETQNDET